MNTRWQHRSAASLGLGKVKRKLARLIMQMPGNELQVLLRRFPHNFSIFFKVSYYNILFTFHYTVPLYKHTQSSPGYACKKRLLNVYVVQLYVLQRSDYTWPAWMRKWHPSPQPAVFLLFVSFWLLVHLWVFPLGSWIDELMLQAIAKFKFQSQWQPCLIAPTVIR